MKIVYWILWLFGIGLICLALRSFMQEDPAVTAELPQMARAYTLYTNDPKMDIKGSSRRYYVVDTQSDWVSLSCNETVGQFSLITGSTFHGRIGFNPKTLTGVWSVEYPNQGWAQTGSVYLKKNSYGGFDLTFYYDDGKQPCTAKFLPM